MSFIALFTSSCFFLISLSPFSSRVCSESALITAVPEYTERLIEIAQAVNKVIARRNNSLDFIGFPYYTFRCFLVDITVPNDDITTPQQRYPMPVIRAISINGISPDVVMNDHDLK